MRPRPQHRERQPSLGLPIYLSHARSDVHISAILHFNAEDRGRALLLALELRLFLPLILRLLLRLTLRLLLALFLALLLPRQ